MDEILETLFKLYWIECFPKHKRTVCLEKPCCALVGIMEAHIVQFW